MKKLICLLVSFAALQPVLRSQELFSERSAGSVPLVSKAQTATIVVDKADDSLVIKAAQCLQNDISKVTGKTPALATSLPAAKTVILVGNLQTSRFIKDLVRQKKLNTNFLNNKWEGYQIQVVKAPFKGVAQALVIAGSDRRGTAYGVFELSKQMGVSPWWWWADVPVKTKKELYVKSTAVLTDAPKVKYRGIFLNDEAPALSGWTREKFGGMNHLFYEKVFELLLRLKANYLWPAMWGNAFNDDDTLNPVLANRWGIVMGTSHHEPMLRAQQEWKRYGQGPWDYTKNDTVLRRFWRTGIQHMDDHESIVTIGMRGDGDMPMTEGTATALLERIVKDQREIIENVTGKPAAKTPQLWALYKEVQDYYDKGMRVPDDVTLLFSDDNWGNIRKLPKLSDKPRSGGYGIYYHFDYVGGPRNYKWINTNNLSRVWEQMHLAYAYGVDKIWIVNVGDLKPMELPISFFLDYAWDPDQWTADNISTYYTQWAARQFGQPYAKEIGSILRRYAQYAARRKPELLDQNTYSLANYNEAARVLQDWEELQSDAEALAKKLPTAYSDAYFELVLHPVEAFTNLHQLYYAVARNRQYASEQSSAANTWAEKARQAYKNDSLLTMQYHSIAGGKWNHMMDQTHIGYTYWQQPPVNKMPQVTEVAEGTSKPAAQPLLQDVEIAMVPDSVKGQAFYEEGGYVSIEAAHWTRAINAEGLTWKVIPGIGRDGDGITTFPVTATTTLSNGGPHTEYVFYTTDAGKANLALYFSPTLNFHNNEGLTYAVSIDDEAPQVFSLNKNDNDGRAWNNWVASNSIKQNSTHTLQKPGRHVLKYWALSPAVILQKLVLDFGNLKPSYLGPPETNRQDLIRLQNPTIH